MASRSSRVSNEKRSTRPKHASVAKRASLAKRTNGVKRSNGAHAVTAHQPTYAPSTKTVGATLGSAVSGIALYYANRAWPGMITPDIAGIFTVAATFAVGWVVPPGAREGIVVTERGRRTATA
jgi:hypothetical protein